MESVVQELTAAIVSDQKGIPKSKRKLQKHLRSAGLEYVSRTGKLIPAKKVAEELCQCPHKCDELVPQEARIQLFNHFYGLGEANMQNQFLRSNMDLRARMNVPETNTGTGRPPRRITCKYLVPLINEARTVEVCQKAFVSAFVITTKRVRLQREKLIASLGLNSYRSHNRSKKDREEKIQFAAETNNNNNNSLQLNNNTITLSSLKSKFNLPSNLSLFLPSPCQGNVPNKNPAPPELNSAKKLASILGKKSLEELRELNITLEKNNSTSDSEEDVKPPPPKRLRKQQKSSIMHLDNPLLPFGLVVPDGVTIAPVATPDHDRDIAIVNNFFNNQLWKPEYIGAHS
ncbi:unnamed protein product [Ceutorhynchus assimilis]|uniref:Uncharacterized protein n=1 Tax=Ceutorhynchus assimilis TaxID=467358 RepID=A0A9N9MY65_9CUCU|nr:unnamed protein product [Ceutorhynchus assimilis]